MARAYRCRVRGSHADGSDGHVDAVRRHARCAYRAPGTPAGAHAVSAARLSGRAVVSAVAIQRLSMDAIWDTLRGVPDPEIPVISVVDLGIVRGVEWDGDSLVVSVTPTYSGC